MFTSANDPNYEAKLEQMTQTFWAAFEHSQLAWGPVVEVVKEALADTPFVHVSVDHSGGGCYTLYAYRSKPGTDEPDHDGPLIMAGPFDVDPEPEWAHEEEGAVSYPNGWEEDHDVILDVKDFFPEGVTALASDDLHRYAIALARCVKAVADTMS